VFPFFTNTLILFFNNGILVTILQVF
jgi:hypothetical protein